MTEPTTWVRAPLPFRVSLGSVVLATSTEEQLLTGPAAAVWELLGAPLTEEALVAKGAEDFGLEPDATISALAMLVAAELCRAA